MSNRDDDVFPSSYKYAWFPKSELPLEDFLRKVSKPLISLTPEWSAHSIDISDNLISSNHPWFKMMARNPWVCFLSTEDRHSFFYSSGFGFEAPNLRKKIAEKRRLLRRARSCVCCRFYERRDSLLTWFMQWKKWQRGLRASRSVRRHWNLFWINVLTCLLLHQNDESIPVRSNKKTGAKSKKEVREQVRCIPCLTSLIWQEIDRCKQKQPHNWKKYLWDMVTS
jgi:hypothetical protein